MQGKNDNVLPWERFRDWVHCLAVVTFDLELGQTLETIYPLHIKLSEEEKSNICYLSFPDSNSGCMGDTQFHFRIKHSSSKMDKLYCRVSNSYNSNCPPALQTDPNFMNGYVYFRQVKDPSLRRGYFQKSVVILTKFSFGNLFHQVLRILAPNFFDVGLHSIHLACKDIYQWPAPNPGESLSLHFLGSDFEIMIPTVTSTPGRQNGSPVKSNTQLNSNPSLLPSPVVIASVHEANLFQCLKPIISHLHLLWELVLTAEPIVVMAPVPDSTANTVNTLVRMIYPLRYAADFRPYFTIHDTDFKEYTMKSAPPPPVILGVTNPFFAKTLQHWPHIIRIGNTVGISVGKQKKINNAKLLDNQPGVYTSYRPYLQKDKFLFKKIVAGMQSYRPDEVQSIILRRYIHELTESFMFPLERHMARLMPLQKDINPCKSAPPPRPFNPDDFLGTLDREGPQLTSSVKGDWCGLYKKFFRSVNFSDWYNLRYREAKEKLEALHLEVISETDIRSWVSGRNEVESVDLFLKLRDQISQTHLPISSIVREKLQQQARSILSTLPEDLQSVLIAHNSSPKT